MEAKKVPSRPMAADLERLVERAAAVRERAYAPYSRFAVGAAVLGASGEVHVGCNVENASYGLSSCAERNALGAAVAAGEKEIRAVAVVTGSSPPAPPCGACRQLIFELGRDATVVLANPDGGRVVYRLSDLYPHSFGPEFLG